MPSQDYIKVEVVQFDGTTIQQLSVDLTRCHLILSDSEKNEYRLVRWGEDDTDDHALVFEYLWPDVPSASWSPNA